MAGTAYASDDGDDDDDNKRTIANVIEMGNREAHG